MSRSITLALGAILALQTLAQTSPARATHDSGSMATLRGFLGEPARYAIFQTVNVQYESLACDTFFVVDLSAKTWNERRWSGPKDAADNPDTPEASGAEGANLEDPAVLKAALARCLDGLGPELAGLTAYPIDTNATTGFYDAPNEWEEPELDDEGQPIVTDPRPESLRHLRASWKLISKSKTKLYTDHCSDERGEDGKLLPVTERCETYLRGQTGVWRLSIEDTRTGATWAGTTLSIEPTDLLQVLMGLEGGDEIEDVGAPDVALGSLGAYETRDHVFFFGSAHHEPALNGTYFPIAAFIPKKGAPGHTAAYASPRGCACEGSGAPFDLALALPIALALVTRAKRRAARHGDIDERGLRA